MTSLSASTVPISHPAQSSLARRLLHISGTDDLPPLLTTSNVHPELTLELYDVIALSLRSYVTPWWSQITRYDRDLLPHVTRLLATVIRALESRMLAVDLAPVVFLDMPTIITQHYRDYRNASDKVDTSYAGDAMTLPQLFHHLQPHVAISSDGKIDDEYYRQAVDEMLQVCFPPEDLAPDAERILVREIILKVLLNDVFPKITQPWFIYKTILHFIGPSDEPPSHSPSTSTFSIHTLLVVILSALQGFSTACLALIHWYKQTINTIKLVNVSPPRTPPSLQTFLPASPQLPPSFAPSASQHARDGASKASPPSQKSSISEPSPLPSPPSVLSETLPDQLNYAGPLLTMLSTIFATHDRFSSTTIIELVSMLTAAFASFFDKLFPHLLSQVLSSGLFLNMARLSKLTLYPNGYPGPIPLEPSLEEQAQIMAKLVAWRGNGAMSHCIPLILGVNPTQTLEAAITPLNCPACNVHLLVVLLDRILVALFPELVGEPGTKNLPL